MSLIGQNKLLVDDVIGLLFKEKIKKKVGVLKSIMWYYFLKNSNIDKRSVEIFKKGREGKS